MALGAGVSRRPSTAPATRWCGSFVERLSNRPKPDSFCGPSLRWQAVLVGGERRTQTQYRLRRAGDQRNGAHGNSQSQLRPRRNSFHGWRPAAHWSAFAVMGIMGGCRRASGIHPLGSRATCIKRTPSSRDASRRTGQAQRRSTTVPVGVREPVTSVAGRSSSYPQVVARAIQGWSSPRIRVIWAKATGR